MKTLAWLCVDTEGNMELLAEKPYETYMYKSVQPIIYEFIKEMNK